MIKAKDAVIWVNWDGSEVKVHPLKFGCPPGPFWEDVIGASHTSWRKASNEQRTRLMLELAIDLAMYMPLKKVLTAFAEVEEFRALGRESYPMCRALTTALLGKRLEYGVTLDFDELLDHYARKKQRIGSSVNPIEQRGC